MGELLIMTGHLIIFMIVLTQGAIESLNFLCSRCNVFIYS